MSFVTRKYVKNAKANRNYTKNVRKENCGINVWDRENKRGMTFSLLLELVLKKTKVMSRWQMLVYLSIASKSHPGTKNKILSKRIGSFFDPKSGAMAIPKLYARVHMSQPRAILTSATLSSYSRTKCEAWWWRVHIRVRIWGNAGGGRLRPQAGCCNQHLVAASCFQGQG